MGSSGPDKEEKKLHILTHTAHAASQVGVELVLILVIGPHGAPVSCWPHLRRGDLKEPLGSGPGTLCHSSKKAEVQRRTAKRACDEQKERTEKWLRPQLPTDLLLPLRSESKLLPRALPKPGSRSSGRQHSQNGTSCMSPGYTDCRGGVSKSPKVQSRY